MRGIQRVFVVVISQCVLELVCKEKEQETIEKLTNKSFDPSIHPSMHPSTSFRFSNSRFLPSANTPTSRCCSDNAPFPATHDPQSRVSPPILRPHSKSNTDSRHPQRNTDISPSIHSAPFPYMWTLTPRNELHLLVLRVQREHQSSLHRHHERAVQSRHHKQPFRVLHQSLRANHLDFRETRRSTCRLQRPHAAARPQIPQLHTPVARRAQNVLLVRREGHVIDVTAVSAQHFERFPAFQSVHAAFDAFFDPSTAPFRRTTPSRSAGRSR